MSDLERYCCDSGGAFVPARLEWIESPRAPICAVDYSSRDRNPYESLWGFAWEEPDRRQGDVPEANFDERAPRLSVLVRNGSFHDLLDDSASRGSPHEEVSHFLNYSGGRVVTAALGWRPKPLQPVGLLDHSDDSRPSYEVWEIICPGPVEEPRTGAAIGAVESPTHPYFELSVDDGFFAAV